MQDIQSAPRTVPAAEQRAATPCAAQPHVRVPQTAALGCIGVTLANVADARSCAAHAPATARTAVWRDADTVTRNCLDSHSLANQWRDLACHAAEPNPFGEYEFLRASFTHLVPENPLRLLCIYASDVADAPLIGTMAISFAPRYGRLPLRHIVNWQHANAFLGTPLVRRGHETAFWMAALMALDTMADGCGLIHFTGLAADGPVHFGLATAAAQQGRACDVVHSAERAVLIPAAHTPETYWATAVRAKKRKELRRQAARLAELGCVQHHHGVPSGQSIEAWAADFIALESAGWKGDAQSALGSDPAKSAFFCDVITAYHAAGRVDVRSITLDGRPIAMLIHILACKSAFAFKTAFDEGLSTYSPGVLIQHANLGMIAQRELAMIDSCAAPNHPMINSLWMERRRIVRVSLPLGGRGNRARFVLVRAIENVWGWLQHVVRKRGTAPENSIAKLDATA